MDLSTFFLIYAVIMFGVLFSIFFLIYYRIRGKLKIRVKSPVGEKEYLRGPNRDGTSVTMFKAGKKTPEWTFKFSTKALYFTKKLFMRSLTLDVFAEAEKAIEYDYTLEETEQPKFTKEQAENWVRSRSLTKYLEGAETKANLFALLTIILVGVNVALTFILFMRFN